jgi:hypothetical protein
MKKLTWDRVVPIISASVSWLIFAMIGSGLASLRLGLGTRTPHYLMMIIGIYATLGVFLLNRIAKS